MSKACQLVSACTSSFKETKTDDDDDEEPPINWKLCALCQTKTKEKLQCPARSKRKDIGAGYEYIAGTIQECIDLNALPLPLKLSQMNDGSGMVNTFKKNKAEWHHTCRNKFSKENVKRARENTSGTKRKLDVPHDESTSPVKTRKKCSTPKDEVSDKCIFCDLSGEDDLHKASTMGLDQKVRSCAIDLQDRILLAKLAGGDMVAIDALYHVKCLLSFYRRHADAVKHRSMEDHKTECLNGIAFAGLVAHIEDFRDDSDVAPVFQLSDLGKLYMSRLEDLGVKTEGRLHTTRLKARLLSYFPDMSAHSHGREVLLMFDEDIGLAIQKAYDGDFDSEAMYLARAAKIIRRDLFKGHNTNSFNGTFTAEKQNECIPASLLELINMILHGPAIRPNDEDEDAVKRRVPLAARNISEIIAFNSLQHQRRSQVNPEVHRHNRKRETPAPIYLALKVHAETRKRDLIDKMYSMGLSISYDRLLGISSDVAHTVCSKYESEGVVCPPNLVKNIFTTGAVDNIDHNPSSSTSSSSFHGTAISMVQHPKIEDDVNLDTIPVIDAQNQGKRSIPQLPASYATVYPAALHIKNPIVPEICGPVKADSDNSVVEEEQEWLEHVRGNVTNEEIDKDSNLSWAAFYASKQEPIIRPNVITALLPLFAEKSSTVAMIKHSMDIVKATTDHLNPGQIPVLAMDQPLFAIAKYIQWNFPSYGEDKFVVMFGGLHVEMAAFKIVGEWLAASGWKHAIIKAEVSTEGTADSFTKVSHLTKTRHAHQATAAALYILQQKAYEKYKLDLTADEAPLPFSEWCKRMCEEQPQFLYWARVMELQLTVLRLVKSLREAKFDQYVTSLAQLMPWVFALDHINYARWLSVHIRDMCSLKETHPTVFEEFSSGAFVATKTQQPFSAIALDQAHEQMNAQVKGDGGAIGLTENPNALRRWMVAGPEISRMVKEFEDMTGISEQAECGRHHEQVRSVQITFAKDVLSLVDVMDDLGNPFEEDSGDLYLLDTKDVMVDDIVQSIKQVTTIGNEKYSTFIKERFIDRSKPITDPIAKNKLILLSTPPDKTTSKQKEKISALKSDCALFSRLYIACQSRDGNLEEFFKYENQPCPPSLSSSGDLRSGTKADLLPCLENLVERANIIPDVNVKVMDAAALVQMMPPAVGTTFQTYAEDVFAPYIMKELEPVERIDLVWDVYYEDSLKKGTREKRGSGVRRKVRPDVKVPSNWKSFLRVDENKKDLFQFLARHLTETNASGKLVCNTYNDSVMMSPYQIENASDLHPCTHEEADSRIFLHVKNAIDCGHQKLLVRTVDTDVVVLAISLFFELQATELWVAFGVGKHFRYIPIHDIANQLGADKTLALPLFHALTGCDTTSFFAGKGKKSMWQTWQVYPELTDALLSLSSQPENIPDECLTTIERFIVLVYNRTSNLTSVNAARQNLFCKSSRLVENLPPTAAALKQHVLRSVYQASHVWRQALDSKPSLPNPGDWGWDKTLGNVWHPLWTLLGQAQELCYELIHCGCKKSCTGNCKCSKASLSCTALCSCDGKCYKETDEME